MRVRALWQRLALFAVFGFVFGSCRAVDVHPDDRLPAQQIDTRWQIQLHEQPVLAYFPVETAQPAYGVGGRVVVAGSQDGDVVAANSRTGRELWRFSTQGKIRSAPTISGGAAYIGATDGRLYKLDLRTGAQLWDESYRTEGAISSAPAVAEGHVVFQTNQNRTYALRADSGHYVWDQGRTRLDQLTILGEGGPTIRDGVVYAGYADGVLSAQRLEDGATVWSKNLAGDEQQFVDVDTRPIIAQDLVVAGSFNGGLYGIGREYGDIRWHHRARGVRTPAMGANALYLVTGNRQVRALDPQTGELLWRVQLGYGTLGEPTVLGSRLWVPTGDAVLLLDAVTGDVQTRLSPDDGQNAPVATNGPWLHMVTNSGALVGARVL